MTGLLLATSDYMHALTCQQKAKAIILPEMMFLPRYKYTHEE